MNTNEIYFNGKDLDSSFVIYEEKIKKLKMKIALHCCFIILFFFIVTLNSIKIISDNYDSFSELLILFSVWSSIFLLFLYYKHFVENLLDEKEYTEKQLNYVKLFWLYIKSYRKREALEKGFVIYSEISEKNSLNNVIIYASTFEENRSKYENAHIEYLKQNPDILKEKLNKAPIETYPLSEQKLLRKYKEKNTSIMENFSKEYHKQFMSKN